VRAIAFLLGAVAACGGCDLATVRTGGDLLRAPSRCNDDEVAELEDAAAARRTLYAGVPDPDLPAGVRTAMWRLARCTGP
jgi:hypothetical protein